MAIRMQLPYSGCSETADWLAAVAAIVPKFTGVNSAAQYATDCSGLDSTVEVRAFDGQVEVLFGFDFESARVEHGLAMPELISGQHQQWH